MGASVMDLLANYNPSGFVLGNQARQAAIDQARAQTAGVQAGTQGQQLQNQLQQQALRDAEIYRQAYMSTDGTPAQLKEFMLRNGISGQGFRNWEIQDLDMRAKAMTLVKDQREDQLYRHDQAGNIIDSINQSYDPKNPQAAADSYQQQLPKLRALVPDVQLPDSYDPQAGQFASGVLGHTAKVLEYANKQAQTNQANTAAAKNQQETTAARRKEGLEQLAAIVDPATGLPADASQYQQIIKDYPELKAPLQPSKLWNEGTFRAELPPDKWAEYDATRKMAQMTPDQWKARVDSVIPPAGVKIGDQTYDTSALNGRTWGLVQGYIQRGDWKSADAAIKDASDQIGRTETGVRTAKATAPIKIQVAAGEQAAKADATGLTQDDYDRAGQQWAITGVMPPMGRDATTRGRIMHAGQEYARQNNLSPRDLALAQATFKGDLSSLTKLQANRDQVVSFEQTAQKNLDMFVGLAQKLVDTHVPWLNTPLRLLDEKLVGGNNIAAVNAARQIANNEIAKVTSNPGLSGQLSDSARHEVMTYNPNNATIGQTLAVAKVLKQDMANRHQSMDNMLTEIKNRIGTVGHPVEAGPTATHRFNPATGKIEAIP